MPYFTRKRPITVPYTLASLLTGTPPEIFNQSFIPGVHTPITFFVPVNYRPDNTYETTKKMTTPSVSYDTTVVPPEREPNPPVALDAKAGSSASHGKNQQSGAGEQQHENSAIKEAMLHPVKIDRFQMHKLEAKSTSKRKGNTSAKSGAGKAKKFQGGFKVVD